MNLYYMDLCMILIEVVKYEKKNWAREGVLYKDSEKALLKASSL